jgi:replicative DNA helicase
MKLTAPIFILKQQAKTLSRRAKIPLHRALDRIANREGFSAWSLLSAKSASDASSATFLAQLRPGDLVLVASRPGQGKTLLSLDLAVKAMRQGHQAAFFTLEFTQADVAACLKTMGEEPSNFTDSFLVDDSDQICADYIIARLASAAAKTLVVVDYLQLLDQKRENSALMDQVLQLKSFARERQLIVLCLSQIDRSYDPAKQPCPGIGDVRLPNPLDLGLFNRTCFLNQGRLQLAAPSA